MRIKVRRSLAGEHVRIGSGTIIDLPEAEAEYWVSLGKADYVDDVKAIEILPEAKTKAEIIIPDSNAEEVEKQPTAKAEEVAVKKPYQKAVKNTKKKTM